MSDSIFFRLLKTPIDAKGDALAAQIAALSEMGEAKETYALDAFDFSLIPGSPFAYWVSDQVRQLFVRLSRFEGEGQTAKAGLCTGYDFRFVRTWWEIPIEGLLDRAWIPFAKGGDYSPYYSDPHLVVNWQQDGLEIKKGAREGALPGARPQNIEYYRRKGLTWPLRTTSNLSVRALPARCIFGHKGPSAFLSDDDPDELLALLAVMNSDPFEMLIKLQLGAATAAARSYEVGVIQRTPIPSLTDHVSRTTLPTLAREAHDLQRDRDRTDETTHAFCLPGLVRRRTGSLLQASITLEAEVQGAQARLFTIQAEINDIVFNLYGLSEADRALVRTEMGQPEPPSLKPETNDQLTPPKDLPVRVQNLLMWCVGVAFGRWDVRMGLNPTLLPALQGPFDPLPRCAPGALVSTDGLPASKDNIASETWLRARQTVLDLLWPTEDPIPNIQYPQVAWDGILVDDPTHQADIVTRVREVLALLWGDAAGSADANAIERGACDILGINSLRDYFRDPRRGFFAFHIRRYSKSRRKAPIYWLLQSEKRNYAIWLYIHRLRPDALFAAGRDYADAKVALEHARLEELRQGLGVLSGSARRRREREIERQQKLVAEVTDFRNRLDRVALLNLPPDLNDGVVIGIAPLWELVPWKEAHRTWEKLTAGEYPWSTVAQRMRERGLVDDAKA